MATYDSDNYRFWAMDLPDRRDVPPENPTADQFGPGWDAIVDEEAGGIVLYCQDTLTDAVLVMLRANAGVEF